MKIQVTASFFKYSRGLSKNIHRKNTVSERRYCLKGALILSLSLSMFPLLSVSSAAVICCPAGRDAGIPRRKAPRHTPRQPRCCCLSYQHSHRQEHKQPATQKQGTLLWKLYILPFRVLLFVVFIEYVLCASNGAKLWVFKEIRVQQDQCV